MLHRINDRIKGILLIEIRGSGVEKFLNLALQQEIQIKGIAWLEEDCVRASVKLSDIYRLRHIARMSHCRFHIFRRIGLPFFLNRIKKRKMLGVGAFLFCIAFYLCGNIIFSVEVKSPFAVDEQSVKKVRDLATEMNIQEGSMKWNIDADAAGKYILQKFEDVTWVSVETKGNKVVIQFVKRIAIADEDQTLAAGNIVANADGVIDAVLVMKGMPIVDEGDVVSKGDILIAGIDLDGNLVAAKGIVKAKLWYTGYGECQLQETGLRYTGMETILYNIAWQGKERLNFATRAQPSYQHFTLQQESLPLVLWRNIRLPVELIKNIYKEQQEYQIVYTEEIAWQHALADAQLEVKRNLPPQAQVSDTIIRSFGDEIIKRAQVTFEVIATIGEFKQMDANALPQIKNRWNKLYGKQPQQ